MKTKEIKIQPKKFTKDEKDCSIMHLCKLPSIITKQKRKNGLPCVESPMWAGRCWAEAAEFGRDLIELSEYTIPIGSLRLFDDSWKGKIKMLKRKDLKFTTPKDASPFLHSLKKKRTNIARTHNKVIPGVADLDAGYGY